MRVVPKQRMFPLFEQGFSIERGRIGSHILSEYISEHVIRISDNI